MQSLGRVALQALEHRPPEGYTAWIPLKKKDLMISHENPRRINKMAHENQRRTSKMTQQIKVPVAKADGLSPNPGTHM